MENVVVALSGGVDSLVVALLLKKKNFKVIGINFFTGFEVELNKLNLKKKFDKISSKLGINIRIIDIKKQFRKVVIKYFLKTYQSGKTPNPCIVCNEKIKFGLLLNIVKKIGAYKIATGHYAKIFKDLNGKLYISKGVDTKKDQSYFLSRLDQKQLSFIIFPIGNMTKNQVIRISVDNKLINYCDEESQDICFINNGKYINFIKNYKIKEFFYGNVVSIRGNYLKKHNGLSLYTIGQLLKFVKLKMDNKFVIKINYKKNEITAGSINFLCSKTCFIVDIIWYSNIPSNSIRIYAKIRYKHLKAVAVLIPFGKNSSLLNFEVFQLSITPGQCVVFYQKKYIIGSGWIK